MTDTASTGVSKNKIGGGREKDREADKRNRTNGGNIQSGGCPEVHTAERGRLLL